MPQTNIIVFSIEQKYVGGLFCSVADPADTF